MKKRYSKINEFYDKAFEAGRKQRGK